MDTLQCVRAIKISPAESTEVYTVNMASNTTLKQTRQDLESQSSDNRGYKKCRTVWWILLADLPLYLILLTVIGLFEVGIIPNHKAGFYCNDPALSFPYRGETVTSTFLMSTLFLLPIVMVLLTEFVNVDSEFSTKTKLRQAYRNTLYIFRTYMFGFTMNICTVEVMKGLVGSPRPTFFDLCKPDAAKTCNGSEYVSTFECTSTEQSWWYQMDSYRSFPSGHASLSVFCGVFIAWYLQKRAFDWTNRSVLLVPVLQLLCISYAAVCSLTRITDHRHHWWDVLVGTLIGLATVYYAIFALSENFSTNSTKTSSSLKSQSQESTNTLGTFVCDGRTGPLTP